MQFQDYYDTLDIDRSASGPEIQKAYRRLARKYHPDLNRDDSEAESRFKQIGEAYEVLGDDGKRKRYDQYGAAWNQARQSGSSPPGFENFNFDMGGSQGGAQSFDFGASGFSPFFEKLFGQQGRPHWNRQRGAANPNDSFSARKGDDREATLAVTVEDLAKGAKKKISVMDPMTHERRSLEVSVPKGVLPGQKIRLAKQGEPGSNGGPAGDLFLKIALHPGSPFALDGRTVTLSLPITPAEAALGETVAVPTLDGKIEIKVPAGSSSGRKIRLRDKGLPDPKGKNGDLIVELKIVVPDTLTDDELSAYQRLAEVTSSRPRDR